MRTSLHTWEVAEVKSRRKTPCRVFLQSVDGGSYPGSTYLYVFYLSTEDAPWPADGGRFLECWITPPRGEVSFVDRNERGPAKDWPKERDLFLDVAWVVDSSDGDFVEVITGVAQVVEKPKTPPVEAPFRLRALHMDLRSLIVADEE